MSFYSARWIKATRKRHRCQWCAQWIEAKSAAEYSAGIWEGDFWAGHMHPECAAARDSMSHHELSEGWTQGEFSRGRADDYRDVPQFSPDYRGKKP